MIKKTQKILCLGLALLTSISVFSGCAQNNIPELVPDTQIMEDSYQQHKEIDNNMLYAVDCITKKVDIQNTGYGSQILGGGSMDHEFLYLFDHPKVQIDDFEIITVGKTKMGEISNIVNSANERHVKEKTEAIINERKAEIEAQYNKAKAKAEARGKTYDKPMKEPRVDDIDIKEPYNYYIELPGSGNFPYADYEPTRLIDPASYSKLLFHVEKYGIPYVTFEFQSNRIYNLSITQESDWIMNGIYAANIKGFIDEEMPKKPEGFTYPEYVDVDGLNKAAKKNIRFSGNIKMDGEGFTWESWKILCNALKADMPNDRYVAREQSSDDNFTYYMLTFPLSPFEDNYLKDPDGNIYIPMCRLLATFDPLSQKCVNWATDTYSTFLTYPPDYIHELSEKNPVNVHEYKVDTTNYAGMRETIAQWVAEHCEKTTTRYCMISENNKIFGTLDAGFNNVYIEPVINGEPYTCLDDSFGEKTDPTRTALYISQKDLAIAESKENDKDKEAYIKKKSVKLRPMCAILTEEEKIVGNMSPNVMYFDTKENGKFFVMDYVLKNEKFENVQIMSEQYLDEWMMLYIKTYQLTQEQTNQLKLQFENRGCVAVRNAVNQMFEEAEKAQADKNKETHDKLVENENGTTDKTVIEGNISQKEEKEHVVNGMISTMVPDAGQFSDLGKYAKSIAGVSADIISSKITATREVVVEEEKFINDEETNVISEDVIKNDVIDLYKKNVHANTDYQSTIITKAEEKEINNVKEAEKKELYLDGGILYTRMNDETDWTSKSAKDEFKLYEIVTKLQKEPKFSEQARYEKDEETNEYVITERLSYLLSHFEIIGSDILSRINLLEQEIAIDELFGGNTVELRYSEDGFLNSVKIPEFKIDTIEILRDMIKANEIEDTEASNKKAEEMEKALENVKTSTITISVEYIFENVNEIDKKAVIIPDEIKEIAKEDNVDLGFDKSELEDMLDDVDSKKDSKNANDTSKNEDKKTDSNKQKQDKEKEESKKDDSKKEDKKDLDAELDELLEE